MRNNKILVLLYSVFATLFYFAKSKKKLFLSVVSVMLALVLAIVFVPRINASKNKDSKNTSSDVSSVTSGTVSKKQKADKKTASSKKQASSEEAVSSKEQTSSEETVSSKEQISSEETVSSEEQTSSVESTPEQVKPVDTSKPYSITTANQNVINVIPGGKANTDPEDNDFLDAMVYSGYNLAKHRSDGLMWVYILCADKPQRGWLSNITYGGGTNGYEQTADGKPNIARFEQGGLVCATYAAYVYFNYLPNIVGIDTSYLDRPERSYDANSWYLAAQKWVEKGYSRYIDWTASESGTRTVFNPAEPIPIGSLMLLTDFNNRNDHCTHICMYAGYMNGYHWVTHVGNANGPEFCAMERMSCGPDPQWPLKIVTTPKGIVK